MLITRLFYEHCHRLREYEVRDSKKFYPSEASAEVTINGESAVIGACLRRQWYRWFGLFDTDTMKDPNYVLAAIEGEQLHKMVIDLLIQLCPYSKLDVIGAEVPIWDSELRVSGRVDALLRDADDNTIGLEIKTVGDYKIKEAIERPVMSHLLQAVYYLHYYRHYANKPIKKWIILYVARVENYLTKGFRHSSPLKSYWEFEVDESTDGVTVYGGTGEAKIPWLKGSLIRARWKKLYQYIVNEQLPPADFNASYTEEAIYAKFIAGKLPYKNQREKVRAWINKGMPKGGLDLDLVDDECRFCPSRSLCLANAGIPKKTSLDDLVL